MSGERKADCPRCHGNADSLPGNGWSDCPVCRGRGYVWEKPNPWTCPNCGKMSRGLVKCGKCGEKKPKELAQYDDRFNCFYDNYNNKVVKRRY